MKSRFFLLMMVVTFCATGCHKKEVKNFVGTYSYKTSGNIVVGSEEVKGTFALPTKIGTMRIIKNTESEDYDVTIVMDELGGSVTTMYGTVDGKDLRIDEYEHTLDLKLLDLVSDEISVHCKGTARLEDDVIVLTQSCWGDNTLLAVSSDKIVTVATRNED